ncbi:MAG: hypothetical protein JO317_04600, partial [Verrucomicrobiae bacterium]|nr:hypothetical protein [Verrucomicrobiae bacterium]
FPWIFLLPAAVQNGLRETESRASLFRLAAAWAGFGFLLFTLSQSKLITYMVPLFPAGALMVGLGIDRAVREGFRAPGAALLRLGGAIALASFPFLLLLIETFAPQRFRVPVGEAAEWIVVFALFSIAGLIFAARRRLLPVAVSLVLSTLTFLACALHYYPQLEANLGHNGTAKALAAAIRDADPQSRVPVVVYRTFVCGLPFYHGHSVLRYEPHGVEKGQTDAGVYEYHVLRPNAPNVVPTPQRMLALLRSPDPIFCVTTQGEVKTLKSELGVQPSILAQKGIWVLLSNRPVPAR